MTIGTDIVTDVHRTGVDQTDVGVHNHRHLNGAVVPAAVAAMIDETDGKAVEVAAAAVVAAVAIG